MGKNDVETTTKHRPKSLHSPVCASLTHPVMAQQHFTAHCPPLSVEKPFWDKRTGREKHDRSPSRHRNEVFFSGRKEALKQSRLLSLSFSLLVIRHGLHVEYKCKFAVLIKNTLLNVMLWYDNIYLVTSQKHTFQYCNREHNTWTYKLIKGKIG